MDLISWHRPDNWYSKVTRLVKTYYWWDAFHVNIAFPCFLFQKNLADFKDGFRYKAMLKHESAALFQGEKMGSAYMRWSLCWWKCWAGPVVLIFVRRVLETHVYHKDGRMVIILCPPGNYHDIPSKSSALLSRWFSCSRLVGFVIVPPKGYPRSFCWRYPTRINPESPMDLRPQLHNQKPWINGIGWNPHSLVDRRLVVLRFIDFIDWYLIMTTCKKTTNLDAPQEIWFQFAKMVDWRCLPRRRSFWVWLA